LTQDEIKVIEEDRWFNGSSRFSEYNVTIVKIFFR
jgi:hypothetical protein